MKHLFLVVKVDNDTALKKLKEVCKISIYYPYYIITI